MSRTQPRSADIDRETGAFEGPSQSLNVINCAYAQLCGRGNLMCREDLLSNFRSLRLFSQDCVRSPNV